MAKLNSKSVSLFPVQKNAAFVSKGVEDADGTLSFGTTYYRKYSVGRDLSTNYFCSLQGCPKSLRAASRSSARAARSRS